MKEALQVDDLQGFCFCCSPTDKLLIVMFLCVLCVAGNCFYFWQM